MSTSVIPEEHKVAGGEDGDRFGLWVGWRGGNVWIDNMRLLTMLRAQLVNDKNINKAKEGQSVLLPSAWRISIHTRE